MGGLIEMSHNELDRFHVLNKVITKELTQKQAANLLSIKERQIRNLLTSLKKHGAEGLVSKHRGKPGNHRKSSEFRQRTLALVREQYEGFGPTLAKEKLEERQGLVVSGETLRQWMITANLWIPKKKRVISHPPRPRRPCFGELVQGDGSPHHWLGEDGPRINLNAFIDDATGKITALYFSPTETLDSYFEALTQHLKRHGRFRALYVDKAAIFRQRGHEMTQMQRALKELGIELILANSPQAKGKVERLNQTLQDRLLKELRLQGIKTIEAANEFAQEYIEIYNKKFSKKPMSEFDAHRPLDGHDLEKVLCRLETRVLQSSAIFQFNKTHYQVQGISEVHRLKGKQVEVRTTRAGEMRVFLQGKELVVLPLDQVIEEPQLELSRKEVLSWRWGEGKRKPVPATHPWKANYKRAKEQQRAV